MAIVAEILLADQSLPLVGLAGRLPSGEISIESKVLLEDGHHLITLSVDRSSSDVFKDAVDEQPAIADHTPIGATADGWCCQVLVEGARALFDSHDPLAFEGVLMDATITPAGIRELKMFSDYEAFNTLRKRCDTYDIPFELLHIASDPDSSGDRDRFGLTDKQYQAISVAFTGGYYESPRQLSTAELASALEISPSAASDLLRRAEKQLIGEALRPTTHLKTRTDTEKLHQ